MSGETYDTIERKILEMKVKDYPGANIKAMVIDARQYIKSMVMARQWDSKNNTKLCRILTEAGGLSNPEYSTPMYSFLNEVKEEVAKITHLNNTDKAKTMSRKNLGWDDILKKAEHHYNELTTPGCIRWPPL
ncbi:MAG: hypothetical protein ACPGR1_07830, partial [Candidatus Poseidoniaceae archaeon]